MRAFPCWPSHDCEGAFPTRSVDNETEILAVVPYINGVFWISISLFVLLYQNNIKTASFFLHNVFDRNLLSNIMCSKMHRYTVKLYWKDTVTAAGATRLRVCVCTEKFFPRFSLVTSLFYFY